MNKWMDKDYESILGILPNQRGQEGFHMEVTFKKRSDNFVGMM